MNQLLVGLIALNLCAAVAPAATTKLVVLGLCAHDADKYNVEFQQYDRMMPVYRANGVRAALLEFSPFYRTDATEDQLVKMLEQFDVVQLATTGEGASPFDAAHQKRAAVVGRALARYVAAGGGLFLQPQPVRYPHTEDEAYWNAVLAPLGLKILHEGVFDTTRIFEGRTLGKAKFWYTHNLQAHPVTKGVRGLYLPLHGANGPLPGLVAMQYEPEWQVLVRGEKEAQSYRSDIDNLIDLETPGTYTEAPPVLAVRQLGKGRIVCYPIAPLFTGLNHRNPLWADIVEVNGDRAAGQPSDSMKMQMNAYHWLAEPALKEPALGTYQPAPFQAIKFPAKVEWDQTRFATPPIHEPRSGPTPGPSQEGNDGAGLPSSGGVGGGFQRSIRGHTARGSLTGIRGIFGLHSASSDGTGAVADYVNAAKAAGLSFIVFNDPLEKLTAAKLDQLKADCAVASKAGDFYACPGIEFTDGIGNRWAMWGEHVRFPRASFKEDNREYVQWDGKAVHHFGYFEASTCEYSAVGLLDYKQFRQNGAHPENLWAVYDYLPFVYDKDRLIADNEQEYLFALRDLRWASLASFTRVRSPAEVAAAAAACFTGINSLPAAKAALNSYGKSGQYVSQGPVIAAWTGVNGQMESDWRYTRGAQRVRMYFAVRSDAGIAEVKVLDADHGPIRRFLGHGAKELTREFEMVGDQQHYLVLEVTDTAGKKAVSRNCWIYCYKAGLFRCGDNCNILGPTAMVWHPDRNQFFNAAKDFRNGHDFALRGWDTGSAGLGVPQPADDLADGINIKEAGGVYPRQQGAVIGRLMDVGVNSYNLQIATMRMTKLSEAYGTARRPSPYMATVPRDVGDLEYYERVHTLYAPMERVDMFIAWNYRRDRESRRDYRGALLWHEGEIRFKKDCTLAGPVPIPLLAERCPTDLARNIGTIFITTPADGFAQLDALRDEKSPVRRQGRIRPGGYAALLTTPVGYHGLLVPAGMDFAYDAALGVPRSTFTAGLGHDGEKIKAGTVLKYRFGVGTFADNQAGTTLLEHTVKAMNLGGGHAGYPVEMELGAFEDATFFFTARAKKNEAAFVLGPQSLIIALPIRVRGLENNGCAAVYSTVRPWYRFVPVDGDGTAWFQEPIDKANDLWVGNVFVCDNRDVRLTLVADGQAEGKPPFLEVHNPTEQPVTAKVWSPPHAPLFGGMTTRVKVPAGDSARWQIVGKKFIRQMP